ncbi:MAG TPA: hypothetical protein VM450_04285 [Thermomicrobiales bacterium]|nr:hypothetical protein [Thermomicrobiales bacterium]
MATESSPTAKSMSDEAIQRGTGKTWDEWFTILDAWGAVDRPHPEIARHLVEEHGVDGWWAQGVTVGYERARGRRVVGQRTDGSFDASASKTFPVPVATLVAAWVEEERRERWLPGALRLRTSQELRSARFDDLEQGGIAALWFEDKGPGKSSVAVQISNLPTKDAAAERKAVWKARLADLAAYLKG